MKYKLNLKLALLLLLLPRILSASFEKKEAGAFEFGLGNAVVASKNIPFAIYYNPANLNASVMPEFYAAYRNFYNLPDINQADLAINFRIADMPLAVAFSTYGNQLYSEMQFSSASKYDISNLLSIGMSLQFYSLSITNYGSDLSWGINAGIAYDLSDGIRIGAQITNVNSPTIGKQNEELPQSFSLGTAYKIFEKGEFLFEFFRDTRYEQDYRAGFNYEIFNQTFIRMGITDKTDSYSFGAGSKFGTFQVDYALINHSVLGTSHSISMGISL